MKTDERINLILSKLDELFPSACIVLKYNTNWELLVAVILSAQCTDKMVNIVTERLFRKYRTIEEYAGAERESFEKDIYSTGFYRNKAKNIIKAAEVILKDYNGQVPRSMDSLLSLPGVARKTANVVLGNAYGIVDGIAVDTHVKRLSRVWGLTRHENPVRIEQDLMKMLPKERWFKFTYQTIEYGRTYCTAKPHDHALCPLSSVLKG